MSALDDATKELARFDGIPAGTIVVADAERLALALRKLCAEHVVAIAQPLAGPVTDARVDSALDAWFKDSLERTPAWLRDAVKASHRDRMRAALEAGARS